MKDTKDESQGTCDWIHVNKGLRMIVTLQSAQVKGTKGLRAAWVDIAS